MCVCVFVCETKCRLCATSGCHFKPGPASPPCGQGEELHLIYIANMLSEYKKQLMVENVMNYFGAALHFPLEWTKLTKINSFYN